MCIYGMKVEMKETVLYGMKGGNEMRLYYIYIYSMKDGNEGDCTIYIWHEGWK